MWLFVSHNILNSVFFVYLKFQNNSLFAMKLYDYFTFTSYYNDINRPEGVGKISSCNASMQKVKLN